MHEGTFIAVIRQDRHCANHVHVLPLLYLELSPELRIWRTAARNPAWMFLMMFLISVPFFTLIHSALLEICDTTLFWLVRSIYAPAGSHLHLSPFFNIILETRENLT